VSEPYKPDNVLDRISSPATLQVHYDHLMDRERDLLAGRVPLAGGEVLSVGCGWPAAFPAPC
jgi:hypothetical protein